MKNHITRFRVIFAAIALATTWGGIIIMDHVRYGKMHKLPEGLREFSLYDPIPSCSRWRDHMPKSRDVETFKVYWRARQLWRSKIEWQLTKDEAQRILNDVESTALAGDWGARSLLSHFYRHGLGPLPENNVLVPDANRAVEIARQAAAAGQPWGFYDLGVAHEYGYGGAVLDKKMTWAYYLRAAELGSPDAQMALADAYAHAGRQKAEEAMLRCAFEQGHGPAAYKMAVRQRVLKNFRDAAHLLHEGTKFGSEESAMSLALLFTDGYWASDEQTPLLEKLGLVADEERAKRYEAFADALKINADLRFPNLDKVLPLPPAQLPEWHSVDDASGDDPKGVAQY